MKFVAGHWGTGQEVWFSGDVCPQQHSPCQPRHPPVPTPHPGKAATAFPSFRDMPSTLGPATGKAHAPTLVRAVGTPPSHERHTFPTIPHSASAGPGQAPALPGTIRPLSGIQGQCLPVEWAHSGGRCREGPGAPAGPRLYWGG